MKISIGDSYAEGDKELVLDMVFVSPEHRGHGVGKELVNKVIDIATELGVNIGLYAEPQGDGLDT